MKRTEEVGRYAKNEDETNADQDQVHKKAPCLRQNLGCVSCFFRSEARGSIPGRERDGQNKTARFSSCRSRSEITRSLYNRIEFRVSIWEPSDQPVPTTP